MSKESPSRNSRSKDFKVKHFIQICILLAICIWFLYQTKHSHAKRDPDEGSEKVPEKLQNEQELLSIGRKGLHPKIEEKIVETGKGEEDERDEETNSEENEDEGRVEEEEAGEDLIDEKDKDEDAEVKQDIEEKENLEEDEVLSEDHDLLESDLQEAREEHYNQDDASSAVVHNAEDAGIDADSSEELTEKEQHNIINSPAEITLYKESLNKEEGKSAKDGAFRSVLVKSKLGDDFTTDATEAYLNASSSTITEPYKNKRTQTQTNVSIRLEIKFPDQVKREVDLVSKMEKSASSIVDEKDAGIRTGKTSIGKGNKDTMTANSL